MENKTNTPLSKKMLIKRNSFEEKLFISLTPLLASAGKTSDQLCFSDSNNYTETKDILTPYIKTIILYNNFINNKNVCLTENAPDSFFSFILNQISEFEDIIQSHLLVSLKTLFETQFGASFFTCKLQQAESNLKHRVIHEVEYKVSIDFLTLYHSVIQLNAKNANRDEIIDSLLDFEFIQEFDEFSALCINPEYEIDEGKVININLEFNTEDLIITFHRLLLLISTLKSPNNNIKSNLNKILSLIEVYHEIIQSHIITFLLLHFDGYFRSQKLMNELHKYEKSLYNSVFFIPEYLDYYNQIILKNKKEDFIASKQIKIQKPKITKLTELIDDELIHLNNEEIADDLNFLKKKIEEEVEITELQSFNVDILKQRLDQFSKPVDKIIYLDTELVKYSNKENSRSEEIISLIEAFKNSIIETTQLIDKTPSLAKASFNPIKDDIPNRANSKLKYSSIIKNKERFAKFETILYNNGIINEQYQHQRKACDNRKFAFLLYELCRRKVFNKNQFDEDITSEEFHTFFRNRYGFGRRSLSASLKHIADGYQIKGEDKMLLLIEPIFREKYDV